MSLVKNSIPSLIYRNVIEENRRWQKHTSDNITRINDSMALVTFEATHGEEVGIINPFGERGAPVGLHIINSDGLGVSSFSTRPLRLVEDNRYGVTVQFQPPSGVAMVRRAAAQNVATGTVLEAVLFDTQEQIAGEFSHSTSANQARVVCAKAGILHVTQEVRFVGSALGTNRLSGVVINGAGNFHGAWTGGAPTAQDVGGATSTRIEVAAGDYISIATFQDSGGNLALSTGARRIRLTAKYDSPPVDYSANVTALMFAPNSNVLDV